MTINVSTKVMKAFLALDETRNFTRAAEMSHVSQSTLSAMISKLEDSLNTRLFQRNTRNVTLTPEGELFAVGARQFVDDMELLLSNLNDHVNRKKGQLSIATLPSLAAGTLPKILAKYRSQYPDIRIKMFDVLSDECLDLLRGGQVELAITAVKPDIDEFDVQELYRERFVVICNRKHKLSHQDTIAWEDISDFEFIRFPHNSSLRQILDNASLASTNYIEVRNLSTAAGLIASGYGFTVVPESSLFVFNHPEICSIPLKKPAIERSICLVKRKESQLSSAGKALSELLQPELKKITGSD